MCSLKNYEAQIMHRVVVLRGKAFVNGFLDGFPK